MDDHANNNYPTALNAIIDATKELGFDMASEPKTGALLRVLAATKPGGKFLEIGTATRLSAAWLLEGMDDESSLLSIDNDQQAQRVALDYLGGDTRFKIVLADGAQWLAQNQNSRFDVIFADAWPGKFSHLELALNLLNNGGMYIIDDLLPQANWPEGHAPKVPALMQKIEAMPEFTTVRMAWASGLMLVVRR